MARGSFFQSGLFKLLAFLAATVLLGAASAPTLYWGGKFVVAAGWLEGGWLEGLHGSMDRAPFSRYFNRAILLGALLLLYPTLKWMSAGRREAVTWRESLGLEPNPVWARHLGAGFVVAAGSLLLLGWFYVGRGWYAPRDPGESTTALLLGALGTGLAVGLLEEFVFRGALHAVLVRVLRPRGTFVAIAVSFAVVHFFRAPRRLEIEAVDPGTGFWMVGRLFGHFFSRFADPSFLLAEFAVLLAIGLVLGYTRMKTRSLWLGIGLHAGWVFGIKTFSPVAERTFGRAEMMPWLGDTLRVGAVSCLLVGLTGLATWLWLRRTWPRDPFEGEGA